MSSYHVISCWCDAVFAVLNDFHICFSLHIALINVYTNTGTHMCDAEVFSMNIEHNSYISEARDKTTAQNGLRLKFCRDHALLGVYVTESLRGVH